MVSSLLSYVVSVSMLFRWLQIIVVLAKANGLNLRGFLSLGLENLSNKLLESFQQDDQDW